MFCNLTSKQQCVAIEVFHMTESENKMAQFKLGTWQVHVSNTVTAQTHHQHAAASGHMLQSFS
jgi:hypothetical protein